MNQIDLTNIGGFPFEQDTLKFLQDANMDMISSLALMIGNKVIVSGVQVVGGNVTNGWITYNGEIIKFIGGAAGADVVISETTQDATFEDGTVRPIYRTRTASIGSPGTFPFSDLKPANVGVPSGTVVMWSGSVNAIPAGWSLHTPLAGKFIVGYDPADPDYNAIGNTGGEKTHVLTIAEMPSHHHDMVNSNSATGAGKAATGGDSQEGANLVTNDTGGSQAHENRPPYYTLAYIIKD